MKVAPRQSDAFLKSVPPHIRAVLLHGSDNGLMSERAKLVARQHCDDLDDVFSVTRISGDDISDAGAISDATGQLALMGSTRLVLVKGRGAELLDSCKQALKSDLSSAFLIVEARDTTIKHAIVKLFEKAENAAALGCYADSEADISKLAQETFAKDAITVESDALNLIIQRLGSDRAGSRMEIEKLALLAGPNGTLTMEDVTAALGDSGLLVIADIAQHCADGKVDQLQSTLAKAWTEDANAIMVLRGCQSYFRQLMIAGQAMNMGKSSTQAVKDLRPPVFFKMQDVLIRQLRSWNGAMALDAVNRLQDCELQVKSNSADEQIITAQCLLGLSLRARAKHSAR